MAAEDLDTRLAQEVADAELAHAAAQFATLADLVRSGDASQEMLAARRRLHEAAQAWCQAYGHHPDAP